MVTFMGAQMPIWIPLLIAVIMWFIVMVIFVREHIQKERQRKMMHEYLHATQKKGKHVYEQSSRRH